MFWGGGWGEFLSVGGGILLWVGRESGGEWRCGRFYVCKIAFGCIEFPFLSGKVGHVSFVSSGRFRGSWLVGWVEGPSVTGSLAECRLCALFDGMAYPVRGKVFTPKCEKDV